MREDVLAEIAGLVPSRPDGFVRVGIDGIDGAGKTTFADALADHLRRHGREVARIRADDFLNPRAIRHRRGRDSPEGFLHDSYDVARLRVDVLDPFSPQGLSVLDVPFTETVRRMSLRDASNPDPEHPSMRRYVEGQRLYFRTYDPRARADVVIDNTDVHDPRITERQPRR